MDLVGYEPVNEYASTVSNYLVNEHVASAKRLPAGGAVCSAKHPTQHVRERDSLSLLRLKVCIRLKRKHPAYVYSSDAPTALTA